MKFVFFLVVVSLVDFWSVAYAAKTAKAKEKEASTAQEILEERYTDRDEVKRFINDLSVKHGFNRAELMGLFRSAKRQQNVIDAYKKPAERALRWDEYRRIFIKENRIQGGVDFWKQHQPHLERASKELGVPEEMIVAIIGVETLYGRFKGKHPVFDSLVTLSFDREKRQKFFRTELENFLLLCREQGFDPREVKGSYAGALGMPQFISSSYRNYAIDFDGDGVVNLFSNPVDVIGSVANYFKRHRWKSGEPIVVPATSQSDLKSESVGRGRYGLKAEQDMAFWQSKGVKTDSQIAGDELMSLLYYELKEGGEYWLGHHNFYVITRYNHSSMYALAAYQLSQEIKQRYAN